MREGDFLPRLKALVEKFEAGEAEFLSASFNEAKLRNAFLNPLFEALGWDVSDHREVAVEDSAETEGRPDYAFRLGGRLKFFVEAKKPSVNLDDPGVVFQAKRYGWKCWEPNLVVVLTNFREWRVYDGSLKPDPKRARDGFLASLSLGEYVKRAAELLKFSREAVAGGSVAAMAAAARKKKIARAAPDRDFLEQIQKWRKELAKSVRDRHEEIDERTLNEAVGRLLDRLVFIRIAEDKRILPFYGLRQKADLWKARPKTDLLTDYLVDFFHDVNENLNGEVFAAGHPCERFGPDSKTLADIVDALYPPKSDYLFEFIPVEVLGQMYEQYLGHVLRLTAKQVRLEAKPEVRKAGGVYYTPRYIVDYIVEKTVGEKLKGLTRKKALELKILDPACGSGSFLLGAFDYLLRWHASPPVPLSRSREEERKNGTLSLKDKAEILTSCIHGVDIDPQAVEITMMSLYLKLLEDEHAPLFGKHILPPLKDNIKRGNSLIGTDFQDDMFGSNGVNAFDWKAEFPAIMKKGGFDVVIGNPPYLSFSGRQAIPLSHSERDYYAANYETWQWPTTHGLFIEKAVKFLGKEMVSFIVPDQMGHLNGYAAVRKTVIEHSRLSEVRYWGERVFEGVVTPSLTFVASKTYRGKTNLILSTGSQIKAKIKADSTWTCQSSMNFLARNKKTFFSLSQLVADPGVHTGNCSEKLILDKRRSNQTVPVLEGKQVNRYACEKPRKFLDLSYKAHKGEYFTIRNEQKYEGAKYLIRQTAAFPIVGPREHATYFRNSLLALYSPCGEIRVEYLVGLLNSRLLKYIYRAQVTESHQQAFPQVKINSLRALPIRALDLAKPAEKKMHDEMVALVERMLGFQRKAREAPEGGSRRAQIEREIQYTDKDIDALVYRLYGLTKEEIKTVEGDG